MTYVINYCEAEERFEVVDGTESNLSGTASAFDDDQKDIAEEFACVYDNWNMKDQAEVKKCAQCGKFFILGRAEKGWFEHMGLQIPKRCHLCRRVNKKKKEGETK